MDIVFVFLMLSKYTFALLRLFILVRVVTPKTQIVWCVIEINWSFNYGLLIHLKKKTVFFNGFEIYCLKVIGKYMRMTRTETFTKVCHSPLQS